jgi:hypothetical protein
MGIAAMVHNQSSWPLPRHAHSVPFVALRQSLPSKVTAISSFVDQLMRFILKFRNADGSEIDIETALHDATRGINELIAIMEVQRCNVSG